MDNANTKDYLDKIRSQVVENLKRTAFAPSVQMTEVPRNPLLEGMDDEADDVLDDLDEDENKDKRFTQRRFDQYVEKPGELSDSEDEEENAANGVRRQPNALRRRNQTNYRNLGATDSGLDSGLATPQEASSVGDGDLESALDTKMTDAPQAEPEAAAAPVAAPETATPTTDADQMVVEGGDKGTSAIASRQPSPPAHDEDTTMEDAEGPVPVVEQGESAPETHEEKKPGTSPAAEGVSRVFQPPAQVQSPPKESPAPAAEIATQEPAPAGDSEAVKAPTTEYTEELKKE